MATFDPSGRREFLTTLTSAAAAGCLVAKGAVAGAPGRRVLVVGGGVGGLTAAHELAERGFEVTVLEKKRTPGGKARSIPVSGTGRDGRLDLPGEHGFRFFPGFYRNLPDTMKRIPFGSNPNGVFENLVDVTHLRLSTNTGEDLVLKLTAPGAGGGYHDSMRRFTGRLPGISPVEAAYFAARMARVLVSCDERLIAELEGVSWWEYVGAERFSDNYRKYLATGIVRNLVAAQPKKMSARTGGTIFLQLFLNALGYGDNVDRVLNGPTNEVWIEPWVEHLRRLGVTYRTGVRALRFGFDGKEVSGLTAWEGALPRRFEADWYVCAVPVEVVRSVLPLGMIAADPRLEGLWKLKTEWMTGLQFFLDRDVGIVPGHAAYFDSPWALTSISQPQFWKGRDVSGRYGDGRVRGILSIDISDWNEPGILYGKPARLCTPDEIRAEAWAQLKAHLNDTGTETLKDEWLVGWHLDPAITYPSPGIAANDEPLLINTVDSWKDRPEAVTGIRNFFLASDYVQCSVDLSTMEGANETARRAVNGILSASGVAAAPCRVWELEVPEPFATLRAIDRRRFSDGKPLSGEALTEIRLAEGL